ncbi:MAG: hypothetical protein J6V80_01620 [Clostridia bacterium]|nr:hypothetical protein [Clostridia bacterium]
MKREYLPGFSPEEIEERAECNPTEMVKLISKYSDKIKEYELEISVRINRLQELCKDWKSEYYQEYLDIIYELCHGFRKLGSLGEFSIFLRDIHSF